MPKIDHIAIYAEDLEKIKLFYMTYFGAIPNNRYHNPLKGFKSYFLSFENGSRLEIMSKDSVKNQWPNLDLEYLGLSHFAISVGSKEAVDGLTKTLEIDGYHLLVNQEPLEMATMSL